MSASALGPHAAAPGEVEPGDVTRPPRVLFVVPTIARLAGGPTHTLAEYLGVLAGEGVRTEVATTHAPPDDVRWLERRSPQTTIRTFGSFGRAAFLTSAPLVAWLARHAREYDAVHVFGTLNPISSIAARVARRAGVATVVCALGTVSDYTFAHRRSLLKKIWWSLLDRPTLRRAVLHVESPAERREAVRRNPELAARTHVVAPPFRPTGSAPRERHADEVLFLSRLHPKKNIESLLRAWPAVLAARPKAVLLVAGSGEPGYIAALRALAAHQTAGGDSVRFVGFVHGEEKTALLRTAALFVLPSHRENFGLAAVEAAAEGLPCVLSGNVDAGDVLEAEGVAVRCDVTPPSIARAIVRVLEDADFRRRAEQAGPAAVAKHFAPEVVAESLVALYATAGSARFERGGRATRA